MEIDDAPDGTGPDDPALADAAAAADTRAATDATGSPAADAPVPDALVVFTPSGRRGRFPVGTGVLDAARALGVDVDSVCGGRGLCGRCRVVPGFGEFAKHGIRSLADHVGPETRSEARYARLHGALGPGRRLGCQARIDGDLLVDVPPESQVHAQVVRKAADALDVRLDPAVRLHAVTVREPDMHEPSGDLRRLREALAREHGLVDLVVRPALLAALQRTLRRGDWRVTVAVHGGTELLAVRPGGLEDWGRLAGLAVDVGSTTIAAHLVDLATGDVLASAGAMNPQIRFGEDLMSRVSYVMMNPGGDAEMTAAVRGAIDELLGRTCGDAGIERTDVLDVTAVANPVMHHLLLGIDPVELGGAPFALAVDEALSLDAADIDLAAHPAAKLWVLPCIAGHVGADTAGAVLADRPDARDDVTLLIDVGTNAEIVLGNSRRLVACSSPTGPAFEGAQISGGQRAAPGAIERVRIDPDTLEPRYSIIGSTLWSDDPGFAEATAGTGVTGICGSGIIEVVAELFLAGVIDADGTIRGELVERSPRIVADGRTFAYRLHGDEAGSGDGSAGGSVAGGVRVRVTQNDVRQIQLAKAALYAGARLLMDRLGVERIDRLRLAGAFGNHIDVRYAMVLGLVPDCALEAAGSAGNAAGDGARIALLERGARDRIEALVRRIEKVETAIEPAFQAHFVDAMALPHRTAAYPELSRVVTLPARAEGPGDGEAGRARRGRRASRRAGRGTG